MKELLNSNIYDTKETIIIMGTCLKEMDPIGFQKLKKISPNIYSLCLEESHINMVITKISGMLSTGKVKHIIYASVDKSPHCTGLHYIRHEVERIMDLKGTEVTNYIVKEGNLIEIAPETISLSKNLSKLNEILTRESQA